MIVQCDHLVKGRQEDMLQNVTKLSNTVFILENTMSCTCIKHGMYVFFLTTNSKTKVRLFEVWMMS